MLNTLHSPSSSFFHPTNRTFLLPSSFYRHSQVRRSFLHPEDEVLNHHRRGHGYCLRQCSAGMLPEEEDDEVTTNHRQVGDNIPKDVSHSDSDTAPASLPF
jgi:hypothetical protein